MKTTCIFVLLAPLQLAYLQAQVKPAIEWSDIYDGPGHGVDLPQAAAMDTRGNFYITGRSDGEFPGPDMATLRYAPSGQEVLKLRYNGAANSWDEGNSIAVDDSGNIYVAGTSSVASSRTEIVLLKYSPTGMLLWESHFPGDTLSGATARRVLLDSYGFIHLGGDLFGDARGREMLYLRYNRAGVLMDSAAVSDNSASLSTSDMLITNHEIYFVGSRSYLQPGNDVATVECALARLGYDGTLYWKVSLPAGAGRAAQLDNFGDLVVTSQADGSSGIAKFSPGGDLRWFRSSQDSIVSLLVLTGLDIDTKNRIVVSGYGCAPGCFQYVTIWYDEWGNIVHQKVYNSPSGMRSFCMSMTLDREDNVYLTGSARVGTNDGIVLTVKHDPSAQKIWDTTFSITPNAIDFGEFIAVDDSGSVYVGGSSVTTNGFDYLVLKYRQDSGTDDVFPPPEQVPSVYALRQNFPNPFNSGTTIEYTIAGNRNSDPGAGKVKLAIYDVLGREVAVLVDEKKTAGTYRVSFHAGALPSGVYYCRLYAGTYAETKQLLFLK